VKNENKKLEQKQKIHTLTCRDEKALRKKRILREHTQHVFNFKKLHKVIQTNTREN